MSEFTYPQRRIRRTTGSRNQRIEDAAIEEMIDFGWEPDNPTVEGEVTSGRFVFYRLVTREVLPKHYDKSNQPPSGDVSRILAHLRHAQVFPLHSISDKGRTILDYRGWPSVAAGIEASIEGIELDPWDGRPPWIISESNSLAGVIEDIAITYRVPLVPLRGQASIGLLAEVARRMRADTRVLYLGDRDRGGRDIENSALARIAAYGVSGLKVVRLAVTGKQIRKLNLTEIPRYDKRDKTWFNTVEAEAIPQRVLKGLLIAALDDLLPVSLASIRNRETVEREAVIRKLDAP